MQTCDLCHPFGLSFNRPYAPHEFIEGHRNARIWIVGLTPAGSDSSVDKRTNQDLSACFDDEGKVSSYFKKFKLVSAEVYSQLGKKDGVAHTDIVKCYSKNWPPKGVQRTESDKIIENCTRFFRRQILEMKPQIIICNGRDVCNVVMKILPPPSDAPKSQTSYFSDSDFGRIGIVLSGYIGRIDNYARSRLGKEVEHLINTIKVTK